MNIDAREVRRIFRDIYRAGGIQKLPYRRRDRLLGVLAMVTSALATFLILGGVLILAGIEWGALVIALPVALFIGGPLAGAWCLWRFGVANGISVPRGGQVCPVCQEIVPKSEMVARHNIAHALPAPGGGFLWRCGCGATDGVWKDKGGAAASLTEHVVQHHGIRYL